MVLDLWVCWLVLTLKLLDKTFAVPRGWISIILCSFDFYSSITMILTFSVFSKIAPQLLNEPPWYLLKIFMVPRGWILMESDFLCRSNFFTHRVSAVKARLLIKLFSFCPLWSWIRWTVHHAHKQVQDRQRRDWGAKKRLIKAWWQVPLLTAHVVQEAAVAAAD